MAIPSCDWFHLPHVETRSQIHRIWTITHTKKHPIKGVFSKHGSRVSLVRLINLIMKHIKVNTFVKWLLAMVFAIAIICSPANVFADSQVYVSVTPSGDLSISQSECDRIRSGVNPAWGLNGYFTLTPIATTSATDFFSGYSVFCTNAFPRNIEADTGSDGTWYLEWYDSPAGTPPYDYRGLYSVLTRSGGVWSTEEAFTHLISFDPSNETVGTTTTISLSWYIQPEDYENNSKIRWSLNNLRCNSTLVGIGGLSICSPSYVITATTSGYSGYSTTTVFEYEGKWEYHAYLEIPDFCLLGLCYQGQRESELTGSFIVASTTLFDTYIETISSLVSDLSSTTATSTIESIKNSCNPISGDISTLFLNTNFDLLDCTWLLFLPNDEQITSAINQIKEGFIIRFPIGYLTDFISIVSSSSTVPLTVIDTDLPSGLGLGSSHIRLDLDHVLDFVLYATSTNAFVTASTSATSTLYAITSSYWDKFIYLLVLLYILMRILGNNIIPRPFQEMSGDVNVSDDSYKLKEKLYELSQRK